MKSLASGNPIPLACMLLVLGPCYLYWPQSAGPALFCFMPLLLLMLAVKSYNNSQCLDRLEQSDRAASMPKPMQPTGSPSGAGA